MYMSPEMTESCGSRNDREARLARPIASVPSNQLCTASMAFHWISPKQYLISYTPTELQCINKTLLLLQNI